MRKISKVLIGPAGTSGLGYEAGLQRCKELGLNAMEVEFTYGVKMSNEEAKKIGEIAKKFNVSLSCHAPYYINLCSEEKPKIHASKTRILQSCERCHNFNGRYVVFHAGFYGKRTKQETYGMIKEQIIDLQKTIKEKKWNVELALETTGKPSQFGDIDELLSMRKETCSNICVDFAHMKARVNGKISMDEIFDKIKPLKHVHSHFSGIEYGRKGEKRHLITKESDLMPLLKEIIKRKTDITIINESPDPFADCMKTKKILERLN